MFVRKLGLFVDNVRIVGGMDDITVGTLGAGQKSKQCMAFSPLLGRGYVNVINFPQCSDIMRAQPCRGGTNMQPPKNSMFSVFSHGLPCPLT